MIILCNIYQHQQFESELNVFFLVEICIQVCLFFLCFSIARSTIHQSVALLLLFLLINNLDSNKRSRMITIYMDMMMDDHNRVLMNSS